jgi:phosphate:Na+ symporter
VRLTGVLLLIPWLGQITHLLQHFAVFDARLAVNFHLTFNLLLALPFLLYIDHSAALLLRLLPDPPRPSDPGRPLYLEHAALDSATVALANAARETLRMVDMAANMLRDALEVLRSGDPAKAETISAADRAIRQLGGAIRSYLVAIGGEQTLDDVRDADKGQDILAAVINFEHISDIVANSLMDFAIKQLKRGQVLSGEEIAAVAAMHAELVESHKLAVAVFLSGDLAAAQRLVDRKRQLRNLEAEATAISVSLLREAAAHTASNDLVGQAAEESGLLLRIARDLRRVHSHLASFAYPVLRRSEKLNPQTQEPVRDRDPDEHPDAVPLASGGFGPHR